MTPLEIAEDPTLWTRYREHLQRLGVVGSRIEARAVSDDDDTPIWAVRNSWPDGARVARPTFEEVRQMFAGDRPRRDPIVEGPITAAEAAARRTLVALTWFDSEFEPAEWGRVVSPNGSLIKVSPSMLRMRVGGQVFLRLMQAAQFTEHSPDDVMRYLVAKLAPEHGFCHDELHLMFNGNLVLDATLLVAVCEALRLTFDGAWRAEPAALREDVYRFLEVEKVNGACATLPLAVLGNVLTAAAVAPAVSPDAARSPTAFQKALDNPPRNPARQSKHDPQSCTPPPPLSRYRGLYEALVSNAANNPRYTFAEIGDYLAPDRFGRNGLPSAAVQAEGRAWWSNGSSVARGHVRAWQAAGYLVDTGSLNFVLDQNHEPDLERSTVTFKDRAGRDLWHRFRHDPRAYSAPLVTLADDELDRSSLSEQPFTLHPKVPLATYMETIFSASSDDAEPG